MFLNSLEQLNQEDWEVLRDERNWKNWSIHKGISCCEEWDQELEAVPQRSIMIPPTPAVDEPVVHESDEELPPQFVERSWSEYDFGGNVHTPPGSPPSPSTQLPQQLQPQQPPLPQPQQLSPQPQQQQQGDQTTDTSNVRTSQTVVKRAYA